ncbi:hypothetical protein E3T37_03505 [Cryobacterium sp. TMT2-10]|uniref:hypothetical protein n=1 Tax=Cryobacterium sp. TMT2-10 TaxID=1259244 RepID=UPI00106BE4CB|nr:hypothetical protein [Cryobacterium sp. TMT2-10]TFD41731.1 hypothetical protein E3T37_03505 [Cryobacterium sp. TMT2-10]
MAERVCVRGCAVRGVHFAACPNFGDADEDGCRGCVPTVAREGALICDRCYKRLLTMLEAAPDVIALIRSQADPLKAAVYDQEMVSGSASDAAPAPVKADLIDASDDMIRILRRWAGMRIIGLEPGEESDAAHGHALEAVEVIVGMLDILVNDKEMILGLCADVIDMPPTEHKDAWTIIRAVRRWPTEDQSFWAAQPCPEVGCGLRAVKVIPPRRKGGPTRYLCAKCGWEKHDDDDDGLWAVAFSKKEGKAA